MCDRPTASQFQLLLYLKQTPPLRFCALLTSCNRDVTLVSSLTSLPFAERSSSQYVRLAALLLRWLRTAHMLHGPLAVGWLSPMPMTTKKTYIEKHLFSSMSLIMITTDTRVHQNVSLSSCLLQVWQCRPLRRSLLFFRAPLL